MDLESMSIPQLATHLCEKRKDAAGYLCAKQQLDAAMKRNETKRKAEVLYLHDLCRTKQQLLDLIEEQDHAE
jgi:hypothetical protein